jgi:hypothetical protein
VWPAKSSPRNTITVSPVHSIGAWARRCGGVASRRFRTSTMVVAAAIAMPTSDVTTSMTAATPGACTIANALSGAPAGAWRSPSSR